MKCIHKNGIAVCLLLLFYSTNAQMKTEKENINSLLNNWHQAASDANFDAYFSLMTDDAVFIGTDATENWQNNAFKAYSKPYFDKGKAWSFTALERNIYVNNTTNFAWFDELLDTQMKICRGSGVLQKVNGTWKIKHYVLSITIPNKDVKKVVNLKKDTDKQLTITLKNTADN